jgi:hypothetical protein
MTHTNITMKAKTLHGKSTQELQKALIQKMAEAYLPVGQGFKPTLAVVFLSVKQDRKAVCEILKSENFGILVIERKMKDCITYRKRQSPDFLPVVNMVMARMISNRFHSATCSWVALKEKQLNQ